MKKLSSYLIMLFCSGLQVFSFPTLSFSMTIDPSVLQDLIKQSGAAVHLARPQDPEELPDARSTKSMVNSSLEEELLND